MDKFIHIDLKDGKGGFMIHDTEEGRDIASELLKDQKYIMRENEKDAQQQFQEFHDAVVAFMCTVAESIGIIRFMDWAEKKLKGEGK